MADSDDTGPSFGSTFEALLGALARTPERPIPVLVPGQRIGRYAIIELLGKGGMGAVYRAHDDVLGRDVALKVILTGGVGSPVDRFRREVVALASIPVAHGRYLASHIAGARYVELEGRDHAPWEEPIQPKLELIRDFITSVADAVPTARS